MTSLDKESSHVRLSPIIACLGCKIAKNKDQCVVASARWVSEMILATAGVRETIAVLLKTFQA